MSRRPAAAQAAAGRTFNVAVVGLSVAAAAPAATPGGPEKGVVGAGKSCLCNRLVRPLADEYYTDHISELSQSDFSGRVVNNDHFLFWGDTPPPADDDDDGGDGVTTAPPPPSPATFRVVEQTEFIDDASFRPFRSGIAEPYHRRCAATKLTSAEKLVYICKNQLGLEHEFDQTLLPGGTIKIDGFVCVFDVGSADTHQVEQQVEYTTLVLTTLQRTKRPIVLATTKNDESNEVWCRGAERLVSRKEFRNCVPLVETSAKENVNVELAFLTLAHLIDRTRTRPKTVSYADAARVRRARLSATRTAYERLVRAVVTDHRALWIPTHRDLRREPAYARFAARCGSPAARDVFALRVARLRRAFVGARRDAYVGRLRELLPALLPNLDVVADRSWPSVVRWLERQEYFSQLFVVMPADVAWQETEFAESDDPRVPFDLLLEGATAETCYLEHVNGLRAEQKRLELMQEFEQLLEERAALGGVTAGQTLRDVDVLLAGRRCYAALAPDDRQAVYDGHQVVLRQLAADDFGELLLESAELFAGVTAAGSGHAAELGHVDLDMIGARLAADHRYRALERLREERDALILSHVTFVQRPSCDCCPFREHCADLVMPAVLHSKLASAADWQDENLATSDETDVHVNLVVLGQHGLAQQLIHDIQVNCVDDEFSLDGQIFTLDYRPIDGDVGLPENSFDLPDFVAHGCLCVYNSVPTLEFLCGATERAPLLSPRPALPPLAVLLASDPFVPSRGLACLREGGRALAARLRSLFVDVETGAGAAAVPDGCRFSRHQVELALQAVVSRRRAADAGGGVVAPDIRILACFMCGDDFDPALPLAPLLRDASCRLSDPAASVLGVRPGRAAPPAGAVTLDAHLDETGRRRVEVVACSYHSAAAAARAALYHGLVLVYAATRCASLRNLAWFASVAPAVPTRIVAVTESGGASAFFSGEHAQGLLVEGNALADRIQASFTTTSVNFHQQTASYTPFFRECWDRRLASEAAFYRTFDTTLAAAPTDPAAAPPGDAMANRPPATLPRSSHASDVTATTTTTAVKDSTSNSAASHSTEDSEPLYERPLFVPCHSDSGDTTGSSPGPFDRRQAAPPPPPAHNGEVGRPPPAAVDDDGDDSDVYCEIPEAFLGASPPAAPEDDSPTARSGLGRRAMYAALYRKSFPTASGSVASVASSSYGRDDSTPADTDSSSSRSRFDGRHGWATAAAASAAATQPQPRYRIRKSNSMRLALNETVEASPVSAERSPVAPPTLPKPNFNTNKPKRLDALKFAEVRDVISRNFQQASVRAPLATPEPVELCDYAQVRDALHPPCVVENDYALVADALPEGQLRRIRCLVREPSRDTAKGGSDSDSERSSADRDADGAQTIYSRVHRRPTPHKKKYRPRPPDGAAAGPGSRAHDGAGARQRGPPLPPLPTDRQFLIQADQLGQRRSNSPSEGSEGTGDDARIAAAAASHKHRRRLLRSKKKAAGRPRSPAASDSELTSTAVENLSVDPDTGTEDYAGREFSSPGRGDDDTEELLASGYWKRRLWLRASDKDIEKQRRKDERRKAKEEEKKQKEVQKLARKAQKKRDGSTRGAPGGPAAAAARPGLAALCVAGGVPDFVRECVRCIEADGLDLEGLYRVPGNRMHVDLLMERWREAPDLDLALLDVPINAVATALKQFLNELSESVIPSFLHDDLMEVCDNENADARRRAVRDVLLEKMPKCHIKVLKFLVHHFHRVSDHSTENSMDCRNLSICWWPTLIRPQVISFEAIELVRRFAEQVTFDLIDRVDFYFHDDVDDGGDDDGGGGGGMRVTDNEA